MADPSHQALVAQSTQGFTGLIDAFTAAGFTRKEARLWVGAWRHKDQPANLARYAQAARHLGIPVGQAIPWYWENIPANLAARYLRHRWRAAGARRVATALRHRDPSMTRDASLHAGLAFAECGHTSEETLRAIGEPNPRRGNFA